MAPPCKLTYFNIRGLAEPIRLLLAHANVEYEDVRVDGDTWKELKGKTQWGKMPYYEEGDFKLSQSLAIIKYLAVRHGYVGENDRETAKMDEVIGAVNDLRDVIISQHFEQDPIKKKEKEAKMVDEVFPYYLKKLDEVLKNNEGSSFIVGKKVSYADFHVVANMQTSRSINPALFETYPRLTEYLETVLNLPGVKEWVDKRPVTPF